MTPLNKKLVRDLWRMKGQILAIALVIGGGIATLVMALGTLVSLQETREAYYERYRFAQIFAQAKRAPEWLARDIAAIPGVSLVDTRIVHDIIVDVAGMDEPARGRVISREVGTGDGRHGSQLNNLVITQGRNLRPDHPDEVIVNQAFAEVHGFVPGDQFHANINNRRRTLTIVGVALSPEFVYAIGPGDIMPDDRHFAVIWMDRKALEAAYGLTGAFNSVNLTIRRTASQAEIIAEVDRLLDPYGGTGAIGRKDQISDAFLESEMNQLGNLARIVPPIFLAVSAFLINIVITRLVQTEREEIGLLKAFGYTNAEVGWHYLKFVFAIAAVGILIGWAAGYWFGFSVTRMYTEFFRFPFLYYRVDPSVFGGGALVSLAAAGLGTFAAVRRVVRLVPAVAMVPPPPTAYRLNIVARLGVAASLSQPMRMVLRHITRWPGRAALMVIGVAFSMAIFISSIFFIDAVDEMIEGYFFDTERQDMTFTFTEMRDDGVQSNVADLSGVLSVEMFRVVPARIRFGPRHKRVTIRGLKPDPDLSRLVDADRRPVVLPSEGITLSQHLANELGARVGDRVIVEVLEGTRPVREVPVTLIVRQLIGIGAYMTRTALNRMMMEGPVVSGVYLLTDTAAEPALYAELKKTPAVQGLSVQRDAYVTFRDTIDEQLLTMVSFYVLFASVIAFGVVFNSARISLSERSRELASLRVLGFTRREVSFILAAELAILTVAALPVGCVLGYGLAAFMIKQFDTDLYRIPFVILPSTYGYAVLLAVVSAVISGWLVIRRVAALNLIAVLKTRE